MTRRLFRLFREPLVLFLLLGAVIFAFDRLLHGPDDDPGAGHYRIRVSAAQLGDLREGFRQEQGRLPTDAELHRHMQQWLDERMLYRQALALGLEERDVIVRRQLVQKMRFLIEDALPVEEPDEAALRAWLQAHPEQYGHGPTITFQQVFLGRGRHGGDPEDTAAKLLQQLRHSPEDFQALGDYSAAGSVVQDVDLKRLRKDFGQAFAQTVFGLAEGQWQGPVHSGLGLHLVRVVRREGFVAAGLEEVRDQVLRDVRAHRRERANERAMQRLRERFRIEFESRPDAGTGG